MKLEKQLFGMLDDGTEVPIYTLINDAGMTARITPYGGIVVALTAPDRDGVMGDVVLGFDTLAEYVDHNPFFGCLVGRYANRIAGGQFQLDGVTYTLAQNNGPNHLHGGLAGFDKQVWAARALEVTGDTERAGPALELRYTSPDGEEGYPGTLQVTVTYTLTGDNSLTIDYAAVTDKPTIVNLTNHSYFDLSAGLAPTILDQTLTLNAGAITPVGPTLIPTGEIRDVAGTPFDFRTPTPIGARIDAEDEQLAYGGGYDHNWVIDGGPVTAQPRPAARVHDPLTGRVMEVLTTEPGVQLYTANMLPEGVPGKGGRTYGPRGALCLETQHYPDSPNQPAFPSTTLRPGETYRTTTVYRFSTA
jgi:aldose 1-epimerase